MDPEPSKVKGTEFGARRFDSKYKALVLQTCGLRVNHLWLRG